MLTPAHGLSPLARREGRRTAEDVHDVLRTNILNGRLQPGVIVSQVEVAKLLDVSRTPVREAMRMLQEGGLLSREVNMRSRVIGFDPDAIEALYSKRIMLEAFGVALTTKQMKDADLHALQAVVEGLESADAHANFPVWQEMHRELHARFVAAASEPFRSDMREFELRSSRYQSAYKGEHLAGWWQRGELEHRAIFDAMAAGDARKAAEGAARHLARTALELLAALAPEYDTTRLRASLGFAIAGARAA